MDDIDRRLISALRHDGRASVSDLAGLLSLSRATVRARLDRLRQSGDVIGYTVVLKEDVAQDPVRALMMIGIEGRGADRIMRQLSGLPQVRAVHSTNGRWDVIAELGTDTLEDLDDVLFRIRKFDGVTQSETSLLLSTRKAGG
ncbi:Lrp/AsnC family transcriptional regulator [Marivita sp. S6314]|uniref:Lrp/AsnC family transcriptional regulator n=1 Tax=Marivita sp. S6314 TaxID=2926406 RepID=UPI001FF590E7|nr:Lrp/AsnC family transcriptional regulator [Marivita sp. S6314]MCK0151115.1 Lrp/AsnC family transcriptional regulator [Marivita sp. S6314]